MNQSMVNAAIVAAMGVSTAVATATANAGAVDYSWTGAFTMLDPVGNPVANASITSTGANQYQTPISGTMAFDAASGAGRVTLTPFELLNNTEPFVQPTGFNLQAIGNGMGGAGTLVLGNMLFNWGGNTGIPVSMVLDAAGFFNATNAMWGDGTLDQTDVAGTGAVPASDGTYTNSILGYLNAGPVPMATTEWNLARALACGSAGNSTTPAGGGCMDVGRSGVLPLIVDTAVNENKPPYDNNYVGIGTGIGGVPMWDGPFVGFSANFDIHSLTMSVVDTGYSIAAFDVGPEVPIPAAAWLFGSGLLGLIGVARKKVEPYNFE